MLITIVRLGRQTVETINLDWDNLGFGLVPTDYMYISKCSQDGIFTKGELLRYGPIELSPSSGVLNYGQVSKELETQTYLHLNCIIMVAFHIINFICVGFSICYHHFFLFKE